MRIGMSNPIAVLVVTMSMVDEIAEFLLYLTGADKKNEKKCDLCGCSNAQFFCDVCVQQTFCASCDQMYHRHPKRQKHIRRVSS